MQANITLLFTYMLKWIYFRLYTIKEGKVWNIWKNSNVCLPSNEVLFVSISIFLFFRIVAANYEETNEKKKKGEINILS